MKTLVLVVLGVCAAANMGLGCVVPSLKTNTDPRLVWKQYYARKFPNPTAAAGRCDFTMRGAERLRTPLEDCFFYPLLRPQREIPCLAPLIKSYEGLPKETRLIETWHEGKQVRIAVTIVGTGEHDTVLICIPGVMGDHEQYRFMVGALADRYDFWLIDPPGCGDSEAPDPKKLGPGGYSPEAMAERELQAITNCLAHCQRPIHVQVVAHSLGGLVALRAFSDPELRARYAGVLSQIQGLVLLAPCDVFMSQANPLLASRAELSGFILDIGTGLGVVREKVALYLAGSFYCSVCLSREEVDHAVQVLACPGTRLAFQAMLREALPFDHKTQRPRIGMMNRLEADYQNVDLPVRIIWGKCDQTLPVDMGYMLQAQLPNARLTVMPDCKHAPMLEAPKECARLVNEAVQQIGAECSQVREAINGPIPLPGH
jgi:pimeloyl-ACP methyl ester carboxylesterase